MTPVVLAFAGRIASGKSTISQDVAEALCWPWVSFGDYVRVEARRRGLGESRATLQQVGDELIAAGWESFCHAVLMHGNWHPGQPLIIDGIRHVEALQMLKDLVAPQRVLLVFIDVPDPVRAARLETRGVTMDEQQQRDRHASEAQVQTMLPVLADRILDSTRPVADLTLDITHWVEQCVREKPV